MMSKLSQHDSEKSNKGMPVKKRRQCHKSYQVKKPKKNRKRLPKSSSKSRRSWPASASWLTRIPAFRAKPFSLSHRKSKNLPLSATRLAPKEKKPLDSLIQRNESQVNKISIHFLKIYLNLTMQLKKRPTRRKVVLKLGTSTLLDLRTNKMIPKSMVWHWLRHRSSSRRRITIQAGWWSIPIIFSKEKCQIMRSSMNKKGVSKSIRSSRNTTAFWMRNWLITHQSKRRRRPWSSWRVIVNSVQPITCARLRALTPTKTPSWWSLRLKRAMLKSNKK